MKTHLQSKTNPCKLHELAASHKQCIISSQPSATVEKLPNSWHVPSLPPGQQCRMMSLLRRCLLQWYGSAAGEAAGAALQSPEEAGC
jgi:hypothetical protein